MVWSGLEVRPQTWVIPEPGSWQALSNYLCVLSSLECWPALERKPDLQPHKLCDALKTIIYM